MHRLVLSLGESMSNNLDNGADIGKSILSFVGVAIMIGGFILLFTGVGAVIGGPLAYCGYKLAKES